MTSTFYVDVEMEVDDNITEDDHDDLFSSVMDVVESNVQAMDMANEQVYLHTTHNFTTGGGVVEVDVDLFSCEYFEKGLKS